MNNINELIEVSRSLGELYEKRNRESLTTSYENIGKALKILETSAGSRVDRIDSIDNEINNLKKNNEISQLKASIKELQKKIDELENKSK